MSESEAERAEYESRKPGPAKAELDNFEAGVLPREDAFQQELDDLANAWHKFREFTMGYESGISVDIANSAIGWFLDDLQVGLSFWDHRPTVQLSDGDGQARRFFYLDEFFDYDLNEPEILTKDSWEIIAKAFDALAARARANIAKAPG